MAVTLVVTLLLAAYHTGLTGPLSQHLSDLALLTLVIGGLGWWAARLGYTRVSMSLITLCVLNIIAAGVFFAGFSLKAMGFPLWACIIFITALFFGQRVGAVAAATGIAMAGLTLLAERSGVIAAPHSEHQASMWTAALGVLTLITVTYLIMRAFIQRSDFIRQVLLEENRRLEAAVQARSDAQRESDAFFAALSHAIRTPIAGVQMGVELLRDARIEPARRAAYLRLLKRSVNDLELFVQSLLDLKATRRGLINAEVQPCDLKALHAALVLEFQPQAAHRRLVWQDEFEGQSLAYVHADEKRLHQVLHILLSNALKYARAGDRVVLSSLPLRSENGQTVWCFSVSDSGPGIAPEVLGRIFQPFVQDASQSANQTGGAGIGLALAHELSLLLDGSLHVNSELGVGSRFWLLVPLRVAHDVSR